MNKTDLLDLIDGKSRITLHLEDGKSVFGNVTEIRATVILLEQTDGNGQKVNDIILPLSKISAIVIDLPVAKPDTPIDV